jgi:drug/metabolite transporter (DMT)-like permease
VEKEYCTGKLLTRRFIRDFKIIVSMSLPGVLEEKKNLYGLVVITGVLGGLFFLIDDFSGAYWGGGVEIWEYVGFPSLLENLGNPMALLLLPVFLVLAGGLFYCAGISGYTLVNPDFSPTKQLLYYGLILAGVAFVVSLVGGILAILIYTIEEAWEWWLDAGFFGGVIGGGFTTFFMYLLWRDS